jgi:microcystin degradation protein MlrC
MKIGILALLHESNTFVPQPTTLEDFRRGLLLSGEPIRAALADSHHEVGGFFAGLAAAGAEAAPLFAARALPAGPVEAEAFDELCRLLFAAVDSATRLDGLLVAPHGATVSQQQADADGYWLGELRRRVGPKLPIVGTIDPHANLSPLMVDSVDALIAYRSNPHLDQRQRGEEAARLVVRAAGGEVLPTMAAAFPPLAINIERQLTSEPPWPTIYGAADRQLDMPNVLSNSVVLGFPYADVVEMGASTVAVTNDDRPLAHELAADLANLIWQHRLALRGQFVDVEQALDRCERLAPPVCLLDMGDNVGGGSAADGTLLLEALHRRGRGRSFVCLFDPPSVRHAEAAGTGGEAMFQLGARVDQQHGRPVACHAKVLRLCDGAFHESQPRHGGMRDFDQGRTALLQTESGVTVMLTSQRMVPFSLQQLRFCGLNPADFEILVAKGVNAPVAAYREVCNSFVRVNTPGSTCADMTQLTFHHRRRPLFPFEAPGDDWDSS